MKLFITLILLAIFGTCCKRTGLSKDQVPSVVLNSLSMKYPYAEAVDWEKNDSLYEAELRLNDTIEIEARIDQHGNLVSEKKEIPVMELNHHVIAELNNRYKNYLIEDVEKVQQNGIVYYQVELNGKGSKEIKLIINSDGVEQKNISYWH